MAKWYGRWFGFGLNFNNSVLILIFFNLFPTYAARFRPLKPLIETLFVVYMLTFWFANIWRWLNNLKQATTAKLLFWRTFFLHLHLTLLSLLLIHYWSRLLYFSLFYFSRVPHSLAAIINIIKRSIL